MHFISITLKTQRPVKIAAGAFLIVLLLLTRTASAQNSCSEIMPAPGMIGPATVSGTNTGTTILPDGTETTATNPYSFTSAFDGPASLISGAGITGGLQQTKTFLVCKGIPPNYSTNSQLSSIVNASDGGSWHRVQTANVAAGQVVVTQQNTLNTSAGDIADPAGCGGVGTGAVCTYMDQGWTTTVTYNIATGAYALTQTGTDNNNYTLPDGTMQQNFGSWSYAVSATWPIIVSAVQPLSITTNSLPNGTGEQAYPPTALSAVGGIQPYSWIITEGVLPTNLQLDSSTGVISGKPVSNSLFPSEFRVQVTDLTGDTAAAVLFIAVTAPGKKYKSDSVREACFEHAETDAGYATTFAWLGVVAAADPATEFLVPFFEFLAKEFLTDAAYWTALAVDAPDPNFTVIAPPVFAFIPSLSTVAAGNEVSALNELMTSLDQEIGYEKAMLTAINRAQGASAAGDTVWEVQQLHAASLYSHMLSNLLTAQPPLGANLQKALQSSGFPTIQITQQILSEFETNVADHGLPNAILRGLTQSGADSGTIDEMQNLMSFPNATPGTFPGLLTDPAFGNSSLSLAQSMQGFATSFAAPPYHFDGFLAPVPYTTFKSGSDIPVKFRLSTSDGNAVSTASATLQLFFLAVGAPPQPVLITSGRKRNHGVLFRYDPDDQQYSYKLRLEGFSPGAYLLEVTLDDLSTHEIQVWVVQNDDGDQHHEDDE